MAPCFVFLPRQVIVQSCEWEGDGGFSSYFYSPFVFALWSAAEGGLREEIAISRLITSRGSSWPEATAAQVPSRNRSYEYSVYVSIWRIILFYPNRECRVEIKWKFPISLSSRRWHGKGRKTKLVKKKTTIGSWKKGASFVFKFLQKVEIYNKKNNLPHLIRGALLFIYWNDDEWMTFWNIL